jgi:hypothetical protein
VVKTWVTSRWKNPRLSGQISVEINTIIPVIAARTGKRQKWRGHGFTAFRVAPASDPH